MVKVGSLEYGQMFLYREDNGFCSVCQYWGEQFGRSAICGLGSECSPRWIDNNTLVFTSINDLYLYLSGDEFYDRCD